MADAKFDAFLTYNHGDRRAVRRIQRFLEKYPRSNRSGLLAVYLDHTDMRGGSLPDNLRQALAESRALVVCWSDNAAASNWVSQEIAEFRRLGKEREIAIVHVGGAGPTTIAHDALEGLEPIEHDVRHGWYWWGPVLKPRAKLELQRLISFLTDADMRSVRNWGRRRLLLHAGMAASAIAVLLAVILLWPQRAWEPLSLTNDEQAVQPVACEVVDGKLWAASWYEGAGEISGARAYFETSPDVIAKPVLGRPRTQGFNLPRRALPVSMLDRSVIARVSRVVRDSGVTGNDRDARIAFPRKDRIVYIQPAPRGEASVHELEFQARDRLPIAETDGSVVVVHQDGRPPKASKVDDLSPPIWRDPPGNQQRPSPARALSVIWQDEGDIWIGAAGERDSAGGLWHSADGGGSWQKIDGFISVTSLELRPAPGGGSGTLVVAEQSFKRLDGTQFGNGSSRVVERAPDGTWVAAAAPPFGSDSEIEMCGTVADGTRYVRVDGQILREDTRPLYRSFGK
jgi:hypothetical protein